MSDVEQYLREILANIAKKENYDNHDATVKAISTSGANYTSELFIATITSPGKPDINIFAKVACIPEKVREVAPISRVYEIERKFYHNVLNTFQKIEEEHQFPEEHRLRVPRFYGSDDTYLKEAILLENLVASGYKMYDRFKSVDWEYAAAVVTELAKFHSLSIAHGEENPEEFAKLMKDMENDMSLYKDAFIPTWNKMLDNAISVTDPDKKQMLKEYTDKMGIETFHQFYKPKKFPVLNHGDYRQSNIMHREINGKIEAVPVDYQTLQPGCCIFDLLYFIFNCSDEEFRRQHFDQLVEFYYAQLCQALERLDVNPKKVYPREDFEYELKEMLPFGLYMGVFTLQIVTVEAADAPKIDENITEFSVKTSDLYAERLNGIINDYIRWGIL